MKQGKVAANGVAFHAHENTTVVFLAEQDFHK